MTTYTPITDVETGHKKPVTISMMRRLRDNPIAIAEGDPTAPTIYNALAAKIVTGGIGSVAFLFRASGTVVQDTNYAGSGLSYAALVFDGAIPGWRAGSGGPAISGTWKALGSSGGSSAGVATVFIRVL